MVFKSQNDLFNLAIGFENYYKNFKLNVWFIDQVLPVFIILIKLVKCCFDTFTCQIPLLFSLDFFKYESLKDKKLQVFKLNLATMLNSLIYFGHF